MARQHPTKHLRPTASERERRLVRHGARLILGLRLPTGRAQSVASAPGWGEPVTRARRVQCARSLSLIVKDHRQTDATDRSEAAKRFVAGGPRGGVGGVGAAGAPLLDRVQYRYGPIPVQPEDLGSGAGSGRVPKCLQVPCSPAVRVRQSCAGGACFHEPSAAPPSAARLAVSEQGRAASERGRARARVARTCGRWAPPAASCAVGAVATARKGTARHRLARRRARQLPRRAAAGAGSNVRRRGRRCARAAGG